MPSVGNFLASSFVNRAHSAGSAAPAAVTYAAFGLAVIGLLWQILSFLLNRPGLTVLLHANVHLGTGGTESPPGASRTFLVIVVNHGRAAATIQDAGLRKKSKGFANLSVQEVRDQQLFQVKGTCLPYRIESHDAALWQIEGRDLAPRWPDTEERIYGWAKQFTSVHMWWPWPKERTIGIRTVRSKNTEPYPV
jgi:hypothetical protein